MNPKDHFFIELILEIALRQQPLADLTITNPSPPKAKQPLILKVSNRWVHQVQSRQALRRKPLVNKRRPTLVPTVIDARGMDTLQTGARVKLRSF